MKEWIFAVMVSLFIYLIPFFMSGKQVTAFQFVVTTALLAIYFKLDLKL